MVWYPRQPVPDDTGLAHDPRLPAGAARPAPWRPGDHAALPLFAQLRRYTLAVLAAAEAAADFAGILYTDAPANGEARFRRADGQHRA